MQWSLWLFQSFAWHAWLQYLGGTHFDIKYHLICTKQTNISTRSKGISYTSLPCLTTPPALSQLLRLPHLPKKVIKEFDNQRSKKENLGIWQTNWRIWKTKEMIKEFGNLITSDNTRRQSRRRILQYPLKIIHALSSSGRSAMHVGSFYGGTSCPRWYRHKTNFEYIRTP